MSVEVSITVGLVLYEQDYEATTEELVNAAAEYFIEAWNQGEITPDWNDLKVVAS